MEKFCQFPYTRPDFAGRREEFKQYAAALRSAQSYEELRSLFLCQEQSSRHYQTMFETAQIRNSMDTRDPFYESELHLFYQEKGHLAVLEQEATAALLQSPFLPQWEQEFGSLTVQNLRIRQKLASPSVVDDLTRESELCQEYNRLTAACSIRFRGRECSFYDLLKHMQSADRRERREAFLSWSALYESISEELDSIYDELVELRSLMAEKLGFDSYVSLIYAKSGHYDYSADDVAVFRRQIQETVTPVCQVLVEKQAGKLGLDKPEWYDEAIVSPEGNAVPIGSPEELVKKAQQMYHELSPETGEFIDFMIEHELFDLESKPGKQAGGYCTFLPEPKAPFIFANFNGTSADVDVLTHEVGHAFESYVSGRSNPLSSQVFGTSELSEIHSMSMEFLTYPWMEFFFEEKAELYRYEHLSSALLRIPYMACVDEFQHRVFEQRPDARGRRKLWRELERAYMPWRSYDGNAFLEEGGFWMQKQHIFTVPFYYIDYAMAQMSAFEFYQQLCENREKAWKKYLCLCRSGGSRSYFQSLELVGLSNPLRDGTVKRIMDFLVTRL